MNDYNEWRDSEIKRIGLSEQLKAEAHLDKHESESFEIVTDAKTGEKTAYKKSVADAKKRKGKVEVNKSYFSVPLIKGFTDKR